MPLGSDDLLAAVGSTSADFLWFSFKYAFECLSIKCSFFLYLQLNYCDKLDLLAYTLIALDDDAEFELRGGTFKKEFSVYLG